MEDDGRMAPQGLAAWFLDKTHRLRTIWRFAIFLVGFVAVQVLGAVWAFIIMYFWSAARGEAFAAEQLFDPASRMYAVLLAAASLPLALFGFILVAICRVFIDRRTIRSAGFVWPEGRATASAWVGFLIGVAPIITGALILTAMGAYRVSLSSVGPFTWILIPCLILAAFHEEVIFRSYLLQNLLDVQLRFFGVVMTSLAFWLVHMLNPHATSSPLIGLNLFGAGTALALAYMVSKNIWFPTMLHFGWNFAQGIVLSIPVSGIVMDGFFKLEPTENVPEWISGGRFGFEASLVCTVQLIVVILLLLFLLLRQPRAAEEGVEDITRQVPHQH